MRVFPLGLNVYEMRTAGTLLVGLALAVFMPNAHAEETMTLEASLNYAMTHSPLIQGADAAIDAARGQQWETLGEFLPQAQWGMQFTRNSKAPLGALPPGGGGIRPSFISQEFVSDHLSLSQKVFTWKMAPALRAARANAQRAAFDRTAAGNDLRREVAAAFYGVLFAVQSVTISERAEAVARSTFDTSERLYREGKTSSFDVSRSKVRWVNSRTDVIRARNGLRLTQERLATILGWTAPELPAIEGTLAYLPVEIDLAHAMERAQSERPEPASIREQETLLRSNVEVARSFLIPSLSAGFSYQFEDKSLSANPDYKSWAATATLAVPLFDGLMSYGRMSAARAQVRRAQATARQLRHEIELEVRQAYLSLIESRDRIEAQKEGLSAANENLRIAQERFKLGLLSLLDLKDAELSLTQAETAQAEALFQYHISVANLEHAMGGPIGPRADSNRKGD